MKISTVSRVFYLDNLTLPDPDPSWDPEKVKDFYADAYPELTQAEVEGPKHTPEGDIYTFKTVYGTKGAAKTISVEDLAGGHFPRQGEDSRVTITKSSMDIARRLTHAMNNSAKDTGLLLLPSEVLGLI